MFKLQENYTFFARNTGLHLIFKEIFDIINAEMIFEKKKSVFLVGTVKPTKEFYF